MYMNKPDLAFYKLQYLICRKTKLKDFQGFKELFTFTNGS